MRALIIGAAAAAALIYFRARQPRGIKNNNPLNIRIGNNWQGESAIAFDSEFETFTTPVMGIRAAAKLLKNYRDLHGLTTLAKVIQRWAPPNENDTQSYIQSVERRTGLSANNGLSDSDYIKLIEAMIYHENGMQPYSQQTIEQGFNLGFYA